MTEEELGQFVQYVDQAWQPRLTEIQRQKVWSEVGAALDPHVAFSVLLRLTRTEKFRPSPPDFLSLYHREMADKTPVAQSPQAREEIPDWVRGWHLARYLGDKRIWPEQEPGFRALHEEWVEECGYSRADRRRLHLKSGYEWDDVVATHGLMPQKDRISFMERARNMEIKTPSMRARFVGERQS
jgi:hypothetical protein